MREPQVNLKRLPAMFSSSIHCVVKACKRAGSGALWVCAAVAGAGLATASQPSVVVDVLDRPARPATAARSYTVTGIAHEGGRTVAVGPRGTIRISDDEGATWRQADSPVAADLVSVRFASATTVWAVGHDSVALRSTDRGDSWKRVLDGRAVLKLLQASAAQSEEFKNDIARTVEQSATPDVWPAPLLDIRFSSDGQRGFAVGAFGLVLATTDGGNAWTPWLSRVDNPQRYHLYALAGDDKQTYIAGEQGLVLRLNASSGRFEKLDMPYNGSFFGIDMFGSRLLAYGLRGNAYASDDAGARWSKLETDSEAHIVASISNGKRLYLVTQSGEVFVPNFAGGSPERVASVKGAEAYGAVFVGQDKLALARFDGVRVVPVAPSAK